MGAVFDNFYYAVLYLAGYYYSTVFACMYTNIKLQCIVFMYNLQNSTLYRVLWFGAILKNCTSIHIFFWHKSACHEIPLDTWRADHTAHIPRRSPHIRPHRPRRPQSQQRRCC